jgi:hypothetical protein
VVPTNISYFVPSHYIRTALDNLDKICLPSNGGKTLDEMLDNAQFNNALHGRQWLQWSIRQVAPEAEVERVSSLARVKARGSLAGSRESLAEFRRYGIVWSNEFRTAS